MVSEEVETVELTGVSGFPLSVEAICLSVPKDTSLLLLEDLVISFCGAAALQGKS